VTGAEFGNLTDSTGYRVLVTLGTGLGVVNRTQALLDLVSFFERYSVTIVHGLSDQAVG